VRKRFDRRERNDRLSIARDNDLLTGFGASDQFGELGLGLSNVHLNRHHSLVRYGDTLVR
jgi:hypothetical protein